MLILRIQKKNIYIDSARPKLLGFYINMGFKLFKYRHAKLTLEFENTISRFKFTRIKTCYY
jgi:hypothetical protein